MAEQPAGRRVALFLIARDRMREVCGGVRHGAELPFSEFLGRRQVDIDEGRKQSIKSPPHISRCDFLIEKLSFRHGWGRGVGFVARGMFATG